MGETIGIVINFLLFNNSDTILKVNGTNPSSDSVDFHDRIGTPDDETTWKLSQNTTPTIRQDISQVRVSIG